MKLKLQFCSCISYISSAQKVHVVSDCSKLLLAKRLYAFLNLFGNLKSFLNSNFLSSWLSGIWFSQAPFSFSCLFAY